MEIPHERHFYSRLSPTFNINYCYFLLKVSTFQNLWSSAQYFPHSVRRLSVAAPVRRTRQVHRPPDLQDGRVPLLWTVPPAWAVQPCVHDKLLTVSTEESRSWEWDGTRPSWGWGFWHVTNREDVNLDRRWDLRDFHIITTLWVKCSQFQLRVKGHKQEEEMKWDESLWNNNLKKFMTPSRYHQTLQLLLICLKWLIHHNKQKFLVLISSCQPTVGGDLNKYPSSKRSIYL